MDARTQQVAELLHEAGEVHHVVYRITDGADDDWASFYAHWLTRHSQLGEVLGAIPNPQPPGPRARRPRAGIRRRRARGAMGAVLRASRAGPFRLTVLGLL